eukprot:12433606-Prorocentrum_lima.AAC.1
MAVCGAAAWFRLACLATPSRRARMKGAVGRPSSWRRGCPLFLQRPHGGTLVFIMVVPSCWPRRCGIF